jgi:deoxyribose-phosphate aldolase
MLHHVDHTQLNAYATWEDIVKLCEEAVKWQTACVCVPPSYVKRIFNQYGGRLKICTVVGFPLGYSTTESKCQEAQQAISEGCSEIDMVVNIGDVKQGDFHKVSREIAAIKACCGSHILKVIVETCYLTEEEKILLCQAVTEAGADYIKTSTGFGTKGAQKEDIALFRRHIGPRVKIKAAGGIRTMEDLRTFLELGCDRVGTSKVIALLEEGTNHDN